MHNKIIEKYIFNLIRADYDNSLLANLVNSFLMVIVLLSVVVAFLNTFEVSSAFKSTLYGLEVFFVILFTIEYVIRLWTAELIYPDLTAVKARLKYARTPMAIIDLLSIIPFYLPLFGISSGAMSLIKLVRFLIVFKINRYTSSLSLIGQVLKARAAQLLSSITIILVLILLLQC